MNKITIKGLITGIITWIAIMKLALSQATCLKPYANNCDSEDMFIFAIIGVGMLVPAGIITFLVSTIFRKDDDN